jgi:protein-tyrosine phosphatase
LSARSRIAPKHHQASRPPEGAVLHQVGFRVLVLCEAEWQPPASSFPGLIVIHCPLHDELEPVSYEDRVQVSDVAREATALISRDLRTLVVCHMGLNRSGLVSATMLMNRYGVSGSEAVDIVRRNRPGSLRNPYFTRVVRRVPARAAGLRLDRAIAL